MTPLEQDKELRDKVATIVEYWDFSPLQDEDARIKRLKNEILQLITADRKRVALEARAATLDALDNHKKTLDYIVKDGAPRNHTNYEVYLRKAIEVDTKIAELKAKQEDK